MSDDIAARIAQLAIIDPPSGWVERAVNRFDQETAMNAATDYASPSHLVAYKVHTFDALLRDAEVYDALEAPGPRADARAARLGAARIVGTAIRFDGADAATAEQAEEVIGRALLVARDREPDDGAWMAAMFAQMRNNCGTAEIAATMTEAISVRESYGLPCVEWRAALDVMRAILDPGAVPWVAVGRRELGASRQRRAASARHVHLRPPRLCLPPHVGQAAGAARAGRVVGTRRAAAG